MSGTLKLSGALQVGSLAAAPSNPQVGFQYYDSTLGKYLQWDGSAWIEPASFEALADTEGAGKVGILDTAAKFTGTTVEAALEEAYDRGSLGVTNAATAQSAADAAQGDITSHIDGGANKHDASEIDVEAADGNNHSAGSLEAVIGELDDTIGSLAASPSNYTPSNAAIIADHLSAIDTALVSAGGTSFTDDTFEIKDNLDATKKITFQAASIATGTTRTITVPNSDIDLGAIATNASDISNHISNASGAHASSAISFDNTVSGLTATNVKTAIDEVEGRLDTAESNITTYSDHTNLSNVGTNTHAQIDTFIASKGSASGLASLGADGKLTSSQIPAIAIVDTFVVSSEVAMLALTVQTGDVAVRTDLNKSFILKGTDGSVLADWQELLTPTDAVTSVNGQSGVVTLDSDDISEGSTNVYYTEARFDTSFSGKDTDGLSEGVSNLYFTDARAKAAAVADSITDAVTDVAPSQNAVFDALAPKLENLSEDTTPELGGDLTLGDNVVIHDSNGMKRGSSASNFLEEEYIHAIALSGSQTNTVIADLTFAHASFEGLEMVYKVKEATSNDVKIGTLRVVTNGTNVSYNDLAVETADTGISFSVAINGANVEIRYSSGTNGATLRGDVKRFKA